MNKLWKRVLNVGLSAAMVLGLAVVGQPGSGVHAAEAEKMIYSNGGPEEFFRDSVAESRNLHLYKGALQSSDRGG